MSYKVLARKYRPQQFDDVIAQTHVTRTLKNALKSGRTSSGYLFTGPRGTGKTTTARILAKAMNCVEGPTPTPCDKCPSCTEIINGSSLDVLEIDAASNTGVDDIRALRENVRYLPTTGKKRIYIIDEVHRLSGSAFDALLKTLEEPPEHVLFIMATTEPHKVPETIRSRTQRHDFRRVSADQLKSHLRNIADSEKIDIDDDALYILARKADGSVRDSMSLLDQLYAFTEETITVKHVNEALGLIDRQFYFEFVDTVAARDNSAALEMVKKLIDSGIEINEFCIGLIDHFRNLLVLNNAENPERLLELSDSEFASFKTQQDYFTTGDLLRIIKMITDTTRDLRTGLDPRLLMETAALKLTSLEATVSFEEILAHLSDSPESEPQSGKSQAGSDLFGAGPAAPPSHNPGGQSTMRTVPPRDVAKPEPPPEPSAPGETRRINLPVVQTGWHKFLDYLKSKNQMLAAHLSMVEIVEVKDNVITAVFHNAGGTSKQVVEKPDYMSKIIAELREYFKTNVGIRFTLDTNKKPSAMPRPERKIEKVDSKEILAKNGKLKKLVEKFDGEIIGVKDSDDS